MSCHFYRPPQKSGVRLPQLCSGLRHWMLRSPRYRMPTSFLKTVVMLVLRQTGFVRIYRSRKRLQRRHLKYIFPHQFSDDEVLIKGNHIHLFGARFRNNQGVPQRGYQQLFFSSDLSCQLKMKFLFARCGCEKNLRNVNPVNSWNTLRNPQTPYFLNKGWTFVWHR